MATVPPLSDNAVFSVAATVLIDAPIDRVWAHLLDFDSYSDWNPFVRGQRVVDPVTNEPLATQGLSVGQKLYIYPVHLPPTMGKPGILGKSSTFVRVIAVDHENHRVAWETWSPLKFFLHAERWQILTFEDGKTKYYSVETFNGLLAYVVKWFVGRNLKLGVQAMAEGLKARSENA